MPVATETAYAEFAWTGVETSFAPGFPAQALDHVIVRARQGTGPWTTLTRGVHYAATLDPATDIVTVTPIALPAAPQTIAIERVTPSTQTTPFADLVTYSATVFGRLFDAAALRAAEHRRRIGALEGAIGNVAADAAAASAAAATATAQANTATTQAGNAATSASQAAASLGTINLQRRRVLTRGNNTPAASPATGDQHVVGTAPTGAWAGQANAIASWSGTAWTFLAPQTGQEVFSVADGQDFVWNGTAWATPPTSLADNAVTTTKIADRAATPGKLALVIPTIVSAADLTLTIADEAEDIVSDATAARTITLPDSAGLPVGWYTGEVTNAGTVNLTLARSGTDTIDGATSAALPPGSSVSAVLVAAGTWRLFGQITADAGSVRSVGGRNVITARGANAAVAYTTVAYAANVTLDMRSGFCQRITLTGNLTLDAMPTANIVEGRTIYLDLVQDATGGRTLTLNAAFRRDNGVTPTIDTAASRRTLLWLHAVSSTDVVVGRVSNGYR